MRLFGSERISGLMQRMGVEEGEVIEHPLVTGAIGNAQKRVEAHNFDIRKHLLEYDNVMNRQRTVVYDLRNGALLTQDMSASVIEAIQDVAHARVEKAIGGDKVHRDEWDLKAVAEELSYLLRRPVAAEDLEARDYEALLEKAGERAEQAYRAREEEMTAPMLREVERRLFLDVLDAHWRDHLYELDHLKGGIGLRAYGQRDPLVEYKREAYTLFETLLDEVNEDFVSALFRVQLVDERPPVPARPKPRQIVEQHATAETFGGAVTPAAPAADGHGRGAAPAPAAKPAPVQAAMRAGRNDPCPCGSGKKYKKCHMLIDQGVGTGA
jgi:preprotein translocase subunit SecA